MSSAPASARCRRFSPILAQSAEGSRHRGIHRPGDYETWKYIAPIQKATVRARPSCVEATVRFAAELGRQVTVVRDTIADLSDEKMHAALDLNIPNYASAIVTTDQMVDSMSSL